MPQAARESKDCTHTSHQQLVQSDNLWSACHPVGWQPGLGRDLYEMRNCPRCGSSLCRQVDTSRLVLVYVPAQVSA